MTRAILPQSRPKPGMSLQHSDPKIYIPIEDKGARHVSVLQGERISKPE